MKRFECYQFSVLFSFLILMACSENKSAPKGASNGVPNQEVIGGQKDENGCLSAAGYTWSQVKNDCVRIFEAGIRLNPQDTTLDQTTSAFIIFNNDQSIAELFLPGQKGSQLMERTGSEGNYHWVSGEYALSAWKGYVLKSGSRTLYHGQ
jgi:hypothetical protein